MGAKKLVFQPLFRSRQEAAKKGRGSYRRVIKHKGRGPEQGRGVLAQLQTAPAALFSSWIPGPGQPPVTSPQPDAQDASSRDASGGGMAEARSRSTPLSASASAADHDLNLSARQLALVKSARRRPTCLA